MLVRLIVTNQATSESNTYDLAIEEKVVLGRHLESPVLLQSDGLSRQHFSLTTIGGALAIEDLSSNGTWLNGALLKTKTSTPVKSGDMVGIPGYEIRLLVEEAVVTAPLAPEATPEVIVEEPQLKGTGKAEAFLNILEPREVVLLFFATASFALISFFLNH